MDLSPSTSTLQTSKSRIFPRSISSDSLCLKQPIKTASRRNFYDKKYYLLKIKEHINKIGAEIARINSQKNSCYLNACTLTSDRALAKNRAKAFDKEQQELNVLNTVLQNYLEKMTLKDVEEETKDVRDGISEIQKKVEQMFRYKKRCQELKSSIEDVVKGEEDLSDLLDEGDKERYLRMLEQNKVALKKIFDGENKVKEIKVTIAQYEDYIKNNAKKASKVRLLKEINEKKVVLESLEKETNESSINSIKKDKKDVETLNKVKCRLEEELLQKEKELLEINRIISSGSKSKLKQYIAKEEEINNYIENFETTTTNLKNSIKQKQNQIISALDYLLEKNGNLEEIATIDQTDTDELLAAKLKKLQNIQRKHESEIHELELKRETLIKNLDTCRDIEAVRERNELKIESLEEQKRMLNANLLSTISAIRNARKQLVELQVLLSENNDHVALVDAYENLEKTECEYKELEELVEETRDGKEDLEEEIGEIEEMTCKVNAVIIEKLKKKS